MAVPRSIKTKEIQEMKKIDTGVIGGLIDTRNFNTMTIYVDYVEGLETQYAIIPKFLRMPTGDEHQLTDWSDDADSIPTQKKFLFTGTIKTYIVLDVRGMNMIKLYGEVTGSATGNVQIGYTLVTE